MDAELLALEGAPSVSAALRALRESPSSPETPPPPAAVRAAAELLLAYVTNALRDPRNPRVHRVRSGNPVFQRALGRLGGCEGAMTAVGFEPRDRGAVFVLREVGAGPGGGGTGAGRAEVSVGLFGVIKMAGEDGRSEYPLDHSNGVASYPAVGVMSTIPTSAMFPVQVLEIQT